MSIGLYQTASTLTALERWQDAVTQNITSSQVTGYKKRTVEFSAVEAGEVQTDSRQKIGNGDGAAMLFPKLAYGISFKTGETTPTRREFDVALQGGGFFEVQLPDGRRGYTRGGELRLRADRTLVTAQDQPVLSTEGRPIQLVANGGKFLIGETGMITQGNAPIGKLNVVDFDDPRALVPASGGLFFAPPGVAPRAVDKPEVLQGYLEASNVAPLREMVDLVNIARAYEANQKLIQTHDQALQKALDALG